MHNTSHQNKLKTLLLLYIITLQKELIDHVTFKFQKLWKLLKFVILKLLDTPLQNLKIIFIKIHSFIFFFKANVFNFKT